MGQTALAEKPQLDDVMLAMDVVDTLRHREQIVEKELSAVDREAAMLARLKDIYAAQGIEVPERILRDGVKALEEKRFVYEPPKGGLAIALAKAYVARDRWLRPVALVLGMGVFAAAIYQFGVKLPGEAAAERARIELTQTIPATLDAAGQGALALATREEARARVEAAIAEGRAAIAAGDAAAARNAVEDLQFLEGVLAVDLSIRVVSRPGEYSGVFRTPDDIPGGRNHYLIVEAVDARGRPHRLEITSEETRAVRRVESWGVRVSEEVFNRIAADKGDDQIIQNAAVGAKPKGALAPDYSIETSGGAILEW